MLAAPAVVLLAFAPGAAAGPLTLHGSGPITRLTCASSQCVTTLRRSHGHAVVTLTRLHAAIRGGSRQDIYKLSWKVGDPHLRLDAEALRPLSPVGSIALAPMSSWAPVCPERPGRRAQRRLLRLSRLEWRNPEWHARAFPSRRRVRVGWARSRLHHQSSGWPGRRPGVRHAARGARHDHVARRWGHHNRRVRHDARCTRLSAHQASRRPGGGRHHSQPGFQDAGELGRGRAGQLGHAQSVSDDAAWLTPRLSQPHQHLDLGQGDGGRVSIRRAWSRDPHADASDLADRVPGRCVRRRLAGDASLRSGLAGGSGGPLRRGRPGHGRRPDFHASSCCRPRQVGATSAR